MAENHCKPKDYHCKTTGKWWLQDLLPGLLCSHGAFQTHDAGGKQIKTLPTHNANTHNHNQASGSCWAVATSGSRGMPMSLHRCSRFTAWAHSSKPSTSSNTTKGHWKFTARGFFCLFWTELFGIKPEFSHFSPHYIYWSSPSVCCGAALAQAHPHEVNESQAEISPSALKLLLTYPQ